MGQAKFTDWFEAGCHRSCRFSHTHRSGTCHYAPPADPEPRVTFLRAKDQEIVCESKTMGELTDVVIEALKSVQIMLGPNSLRLLTDGHRLRLTDGEYEAMALSVAAVLTSGEY